MSPFAPARLPLLLLALIGLCSCSDDGSTLGDDDADSASQSDDDDSANQGDDDDSAVHSDDYGIRFVTFAASLDGRPEASSAAGYESTMLSGHFQFIYWSDIDTAAIVCRQHFVFEAVARFGQAQSNACEGCGGQFSVMSTSPSDGLHDDDCPTLPPSIDLSFLLTANDVTVSADFRELSLVSLQQLVESNWQLSSEGLGAAEIEQGYQDAGLDAYWIAMVDSHGWLAGKAGLTEVANPWEHTKAALPMFVAYRNPEENPAGWALDGLCFLSTLWAVRVGKALGTNPLP